MDQTVREKLQTFFSQYPSLKFKKGEIILRSGENPTGIVYVERGLIRQYWISKEGSEITLNMYKPHTFLPMSWAIAGTKNTHFYEAMDNLTVRRTPKEAVLEFLKREPVVLYDLLQRIYIGMEGLWMHIESLTSGNSYVKLLASLEILAKRFGKKEKNITVLQIKMSEKDIANYAGISRETVSREFQKLKKDHIAEFDRGIISVNTEKLEHTLFR